METTLCQQHLTIAKKLTAIYHELSRTLIEVGREVRQSWRRCVVCCVAKNVTSMTVLQKRTTSVIVHMLRCRRFFSLTVLQSFLGPMVPAKWTTLRYPSANEVTGDATPHASAQFCSKLAVGHMCCFSFLLAQTCFMSSQEREAESLSRITVCCKC